MPTNAIPAWAMGVLSPYASVNLVFSSMPSTMAETGRGGCRLQDSGHFLFECCSYAVDLCTVRPMTMRKGVNRALRGLTGYELRKVKPPTAKPAPAPVVKPEPKPEPPKPAGPPEIKFPADYDEAARDVIRAVKPWTMTSPEKLNALI